jgi:hypothetical protein
MLNVSDSALLVLQNELLRNSPVINGLEEYRNTTMVQKAAYFLMVNGLRSIRLAADEATLFQKLTGNANSVSGPFLIIMIIGILLSTISTFAILY